MHAEYLMVDGATMSCAAVAAPARPGARVAVAPEGLARAAASHAGALAAVGGSAFYGRTTGVGADSAVAVAPGSGHGLRLLRSHAGGPGSRSAPMSRRQRLPADDGDHPLDVDVAAAEQVIADRAGAWAS